MSRMEIKVPMMGLYDQVRIPENYLEEIGMRALSRLRSEKSKEIRSIEIDAHDGQFGVVRVPLEQLLTGPMLARFIRARGEGTLTDNYPEESDES